MSLVALASLLGSALLRLEQGLQQLRGVRLARIGGVVIVCAASEYTVSGKSGGLLLLRRSGALAALLVLGGLADHGCFSLDLGAGGEDLTQLVLVLLVLALTH